MARAARLVDIPRDQFFRYLSDRVPGDDAKRKIADGLELDGNYILGIGKRFDGMTLREKLTHMALDRYLEAHSHLDNEIDELRYLGLWSK